MSHENTKPTIRVLLVDNHPVVRTGLALMLRYEPDMEAVAEASNGTDAINLFRQLLPDITLMDLRMPGMDGTQATTAIRTEFPNARIILFSTYDGDEDIYRGLQAGAKAYLLKDAPCEELLETIRLVASGQTYITAGVGAKLVERIAGTELTEREREVVRLMAKGHSNQNIAVALFITEATVKFHVNNILNKLNVNDRTQAVITAVKRGIALLD